MLQLHEKRSKSFHSLNKPPFRKHIFLLIALQFLSGFFDLTHLVTVIIVGRCYVEGREGDLPSIVSCQQCIVAVA